MPMSEFIKNLRSKVGSDLLLLPSATIIHFDSQNRMLLLKHSNTQHWVAPGGAIEPHETPANAAVREMWEETGLYVRLTKLLGIFGGPGFVVNYANGDSACYVMTAFECDIISGELNDNDSEALEFAYVSQNELAGLNLAPWAKIVLPKLFAERGKTIFQSSTWTPNRISKQ